MAPATRGGEARRGAANPLAAAAGKSGAALAMEFCGRAASLWDARQVEAAALAVDRALELDPRCARALCFGGFMLGELGRAEKAIAFYRRAVAIDPAYSVAWTNLGKLEFKLGAFASAGAAFESAVAARPSDADAWNCLSAARRELGDLDAAAAAARRALAIRPDFAEARLNLGNALFKADMVEDALVAYRAAAPAAPGLAAAHCGVALCLKSLGALDEASAAFAAAEALGSVEAVSGLGCLRLSLGDFENGWEGYERRWVSGKSLEEAFGSRLPRWDGTLTPGLRVLVLNDHGLGDTLQFFRYVKLMAAAGLIVDFIVPPRLHRILSGDPAIRLREAAEGVHDAQIPLSSLPRAFRTRLDTIPAATPYLAVDAGRARAWRERLGSAGFKIGVCWQGNPNPEADMARSIPLAAFQPLHDAPGARLISLQKGFGVEQIDAVAGRMRIETLGGEFDSGPDAFVDTAAAMVAVDLVVTCDTSIAHLAGALGRPVWVALKHDAEWRWLRERRDSPWYPTMRLFRQPRRGEWAPVFEEMAAELRALSGDRVAAGAVEIPVPLGELFDKISILGIKERRLGDPGKLAAVRTELGLLRLKAAAFEGEGVALAERRSALDRVNESLWDVEDRLRDMEARRDFGADFVEAARSVYRLNDERARVKGEIGRLLGSSLVEVKSYAPY